MQGERGWALAQQGPKQGPRGLAGRSRRLLGVSWETESGRLRLLSGRQFVAQFPRLALEVLQHALLVRLLVLLLPLRHVLLPVLEHLVDDPRQLVRRRRYRLGYAAPRGHAAEEGTQGALRALQVSRRQAQRLRRPVYPGPRRRRQQIAARLPRARRQPQPAAEALLAGPAAHVGADFAEHHQGRPRLDPLDGRQVYPRHLLQPPARVEARLVVLALAQPRRRPQRLDFRQGHALELLFDGLVALADLRMMV